MSNRRTRRQQGRQKARVAMVPLKSITWPWQMDDKMCAIALQDRVVQNLLQTKHPLHHLAESGAIVTPDPTTEYYLSRLEGTPAYQDQVASIRRLAAERDSRQEVPKAVPVNRTYYGVDPFARH